MKKFAIIVLIALVSCAKSSDDKYDPSKYLNDDQRKEALSGIVTYIFSAPPYVAMKDRFKPEYKYYYDSMSQRLFSLDRFYVDENKRRHYLIIRPGNSADEKRAVGGYYDLDANDSIKNFREAFVTPISPDSAARGKGRFLFDQMVKHNLEPYFKMKSYVQWPSPISYYDSTVYEWKMDVSLQDSVTTDSTNAN